MDNERLTVFGVYVVAKTVNLEIARCHSADYVKESISLVFLLQPIWFSRLVVAVLLVQFNSLFTLT